MKPLTVYKNDGIILEKVGLADKFFLRLKGLMFKKSLDFDSGLLIVPCNQIHTFCMKFSIDVVYLDKNDNVVFVDEAVPPGKMCKMHRDAKKVLSSSTLVESERVFRASLRVLPI